MHHGDALPDESSRYEEEGVHVVSHCVPTSPADPSRPAADWMHSAEGIRVRTDLLPAFSTSLARLTHLIAALEDQHAP